VTGPTYLGTLDQARASAPTLQSYVIVGGGTSSGMRVGDQITFYRPRVTDERGIVYPSSDIGVAQILRVTPYASTALIIDQIVRPGPAKELWLAYPRRCPEAEARLH
jgi:hypothetical protein